MIIQRRGSDLWLIRQPDHAALAADLMSHWQLGGLPDHPRREGILTATREHDTGWREEDEAMHVDESGAPLDFVAVPSAVKQRIWPRAVDRLAPASAYVAALVAQHALTVHAPLRQDPAWHAFFALMERCRAEQLARATPDEAVNAGDDYPFVRIGDQLSLVFCNGWTAPMAGIGYRAILSGTTLEITPDPFAGRRIPMRVEARVIPARTYPSPSELGAAFAGAQAVALEGVATGA